LKNTFLASLLISTQCSWLGGSWLASFIKGLLKISNFGLFQKFFQYLSSLGLSASWTKKLKRFSHRYL